MIYIFVIVALIFVIAYVNGVANEVRESVKNPLSGGLMYSFRDKSRTELKPIFKLKIDNGDIQYVPLLNPVQLGCDGNPIDENGNRVEIYYYPYDKDGYFDPYYLRYLDRNDALIMVSEGYTGSQSIPAQNSRKLQYQPN